MLVSHSGYSNRESAALLLYFERWKKQRHKEGRVVILGQQDEALPLTQNAQQLMKTAQQMAAPGQLLGANHWLLALLAICPNTAAELAPGLDAKSAGPSLENQLKSGRNGAPLTPAMLLAKSGRHAQSQERTEITERDLGVVIISAAGFMVQEFEKDTSRTTPTTGAGKQGVRQHSPILEQFGRNLTLAAEKGKLWPVIGREEEMQLMIETLCRRTKRNPALVGPAGVGKTAIVEGLASKLVKGEAPEMLKGAQIWAVEPTALVSGAHDQAEFGRIVQALLREASHPDILLFIDEMHSLIGAGGSSGRDDLGSMLKPALARGDIACIAATTDEEYRRFIEMDTALERRFQPIRVQEPLPAQTLLIMHSLRDEISRHNGVQLSDSLLERLYEMAERYFRNRRFPDKGVDLLEQCMAHALASGRANVTIQDAEEVVRRLVGMPISARDRLVKLKDALNGLSLLPAAETEELLHQISASLRGLDMHPERPNAVLLLIGEMAAEANLTAETIASALLGDIKRLITIDFSRMTEAHQISMLIGSPPGYVGYEDRLAIHEIAQMGWCVLHCRGIDSCHPSIRDVLQQALATGLLTDSNGKRIFLSDAIVVLSAEITASHTRRIGLIPEKEQSAEDPRNAAERVLGSAFLSQVDVICAAKPDTNGETYAAMDDRLNGLIARYKEQGLLLEWDPSFVDWLHNMQKHAEHPRDWERVLERNLGGVLTPLLPDIPPETPLAIAVSVEEGQLKAGYS